MPTIFSFLIEGIQYLQEHPQISPVIQFIKLTKRHFSVVIIIIVLVCAVNSILELRTVRMETQQVAQENLFWEVFFPEKVEEKSLYLYIQENWKSVLLRVIIWSNLNIILKLSKLVWNFFSKYLVSSIPSLLQFCYVQGNFVALRREIALVRNTMVNFQDFIALQQIVKELEYKLKQFQDDIYERISRINKRDWIELQQVVQEQSLFDKKLCLLQKEVSRVRCMLELFMETSELTVKKAMSDSNDDGNEFTVTTSTLNTRSTF